MDVDNVLNHPPIGYIKEDEFELLASGEIDFAHTENCSGSLPLKIYPIYSLAGSPFVPEIMPRETVNYGVNLAKCDECDVEKLISRGGGENGSNRS